MSSSDFKPPNTFFGMSKDGDAADKGDGTERDDGSGSETETHKSTVPSGQDNTGDKGKDLGAGGRGSEKEDFADLAKAVPGLYRVLDLMHERGSGGLVDKIIIEQDSLGRFINDIHPHAYTSITKVDFAALDQVDIKPIGIYGSKSAIVDYLKDKDLVDERAATALLRSTDNKEAPSLRSGMYVLRDKVEGAVYVIYWPEETTWDDNTASSVRRNRITFMRYLTKITDQVVCLLSDEHAQTIVWRDEVQSEDEDMDDDDDDRLFAFEVSKTNEQEEGITSRPAFTLTSAYISDRDPPADSGVDATLLRPRVASGETQQAILMVEYVSAQKKQETLNEVYHTSRLKDTLQRDLVRLSDDLSSEAIEVLLDAGLRHGAPDAVADYKKAVKEVNQSAHERKQYDLDVAMKRIDSEGVDLLHCLEESLMSEVLIKFPILAQVSVHTTGPAEPEFVPLPPDDGMPFPLDVLCRSNIQPAPLKELCTLYPDVSKMLQEVNESTKLNQVTSGRFGKLKDRLLGLDYLLGVNEDLDEHERKELVESIIDHGLDKQLSAAAGTWMINKAKAVFGSLMGSDSSPTRVTDVPREILQVHDSVFLSRLGHIADMWPMLAQVATRAAGLARHHFQDTVKKEAKTLQAKIMKIQRGGCFDWIKRSIDGSQKHQLEQLRVNLLEALKASSPRVPGAKKVLTVKHLERNTLYHVSHGYGSSNQSYRIAVMSQTYTEPTLLYSLFPLELVQDDRHRMQEDPSHIPHPCIHPNSSSKFTLPADTTLLYFHLLPGSRCFLITRDRAGDGCIYVSSTATLQDAVSRRPTKELKRDKIGENILLSYDESKRILAICSVSGRDSRLQLNTFAFDETYASLQGMGSAVNLGPWYDGAIAIKHMAFVSGSEELVFVDNFARARVFSLVTQQFRPATLQLPAVPSAIHAAPDGSCFLAVYHTEGYETGSIRAYHWTSFGSSEGILVDIPEAVLKLKGTVITSLMSRNNVYLLALDPPEHALRSVAFSITRKVTEFTFKEKGGGGGGRHGKDQFTRHNCLIDCHADIWTRFPVVPAVRRETIISSSLRQPRSLTFVSSNPRSPFASHFSALIDDFERTTRKPTNGELSSIHILAVNHQDFADQYPFVPSTFHAGEWLVELLCLIPIHVAVTRDNRFVPLKDGVWSAELERSLLGADVAKIVDSISFGWYESLFQSYMAKKPVKVVSSMGEQSVGKSFALNHLVDTSFAGSAMRTTEGVWMSVTPTDEALIVALDFEGVHSIERSAQEDTLLVLFNTAISNLVLFRNNFALSRDITGLFQSFQSSASVLDPDANPMLFQSTLVIIIKDVVESDKNEIKKEFHLKFQQIVQAEQAMNFITRLHRNRLDIVPWPVIESKQFYTLFKAIKRRLDQQAITHTGGAIFLQTMKTLMAKLKANDWGSMSQNLATHRAQLLLSLLPNALAFGASEVVPDFEPLTDFDTAAIVDMPDTRSEFYIVQNGPKGQPAGREEALQALCSVWDAFSQRFDFSEAEWVERLQASLDEKVDMRIEHVRSWLVANTAKFPATHADIQGLHRTFDGLAIDLKAGVQLCGMKCKLCNLNCILGRHHDGEHDCHTDHLCPRHCQFTEGADHEGQEPVACGLLAGHPGPHMCDVAAHTCGQDCKLKGKRGCQVACVKTIDHDGEEHMCAAKVHECGMPCSLSGVRLPNGRLFECDQPCSISSDIPHSEHRCDSRQCPIGCQLCKRLCGEHDHLHGLHAGTVHLCGQEHACSALCSANGICQIETAPQSVEATFTGRHESFQYTKYTQVSKRLPCVVMIPPGETEHHGEHSHDLGAKCFHHCETRCPDCGYFCTLPLGHPQQEHETSHGSMSKTKWAVDGPDGTALEVNGRKFGTNDDGAPMLCSMYCRSMGRHAHIDWCRSGNPRACAGAELEHINAPMQPHPQKAKDWISHNLYWKRTGFKDPYSQEDQANFAKCDRMCGGPEHNATAQAAAQPSYCTLPILHPRQPLDRPPPGGLGYVSNDGHAFLCRNPAVLRQAFHVIFVIDRSGSMDLSDRRPLNNTPTSQLIRRTHNNRLGAVCSSLQAFWEARHQAMAAAAAGNGGAVRRDAYTVILFNHGVTSAIAHDFRSAPVDLLNALLRHRADGGTNYTAAITAARTSMENNWSTERSPVIIFLSDGECSIADETMQDLCRRSIALGKPLSFHSVAFGPRTDSLRRMAQIARDVESRAPPDPVNPHAGIPSSYTEALDTIRLAETFLGIADSLAKPRGALFRG
ncbi:hypothetical protein L226DRAFT_549908 [Lentinus tigrinus ALCF2SS1-7]|uniref:uncharacterized protein n=1 Tax=Lentinus tigrinus ALCF2SS1-7 TaxID=1328758 RepID=UPI0011661421|nr:hypothetical protein L226DRAFT_549908 [Lentinus tigrinus ALCF2SS1-7]